MDNQRTALRVMWRTGLAPITEGTVHNRVSGTFLATEGDPGSEFLQSPIQQQKAA